jgi:hypothetical protein
MDSTPNPYHPPPFDPKQFQDQPQYSGAAASDYGWVNQVRIFALLNAAQGMLEIPMGLFTTGMGVALPTMMQWAAAQDKEAAKEMPPEAMMWMLGGFYLAIGIPVLISGVLRIVAGVKNYRFRGRTLGLVSMIGGLSSMLSCYCAPTAVGLLVYGLILYMNPAVKAAFQMVEQGQTVDQVLAAFNPYQQTYYQQQPPPLGGGERPFA